MNTVYRGGEAGMVPRRVGERVGCGTLLHCCRQPGWWARLVHGVPAGQRWACDCGATWRWNGLKWRQLEPVELVVYP